jgi:hypothetical protein
MGIRKAHTRIARVGAVVVCGAVCFPDNEQTRSDAIDPNTRAPQLL